MTRQMLDDLVDLEDKVEAIKITLTKKIDKQCRQTLGRMFYDLSERRQNLVNTYNEQQKALFAFPDEITHENIQSEKQTTSGGLQISDNAHNGMNDTERPVVGISPDSAIGSELSTSPTRKDSAAIAGASWSYITITRETMLHIRDNSPLCRVPPARLDPSCVHPQTGRWVPERYFNMPVRDSRTQYQQQLSDGSGPRPAKIMMPLNNNQSPPPPHVAQSPSPVNHTVLEVDQSLEDEIYEQVFGNDNQVEIYDEIFGNDNQGEIYDEIFGSNQSQQNN